MYLLKVIAILELLVYCPTNIWPILPDITTQCHVHLYVRLITCSDDPSFLQVDLKRLLSR